MHKRAHILSLPLALGVALFASTAVPASPQLLEAEDAFRLSATSDGDTVILHWRIAEDYYMYRERFTVAVEGAAHSTLQSPRGVFLHDAQFGEVEVYYKEVRLRVPIVRALHDGDDELRLHIKASGQGCNEPVGVCYPPLRQEARVVLAAGDGVFSDDASVAGHGAGDGASDGVASFLQDLARITDDANQFLPVDKAFQATLEVINPVSTSRTDDVAAGDVASDTSSSDASHSALQINFIIARGYYLYRDKIMVQSLQPQVQLASLNLPTGEVKADPYFGDTQIYRNEISFITPLSNVPDDLQKASFAVSWQGCAEDGICYLPVTARAHVDLHTAGARGIILLSASNDVTSLNNGNDNNANVNAVNINNEAGDGDDQVARLTWAWLLSAFGAGLLLTFTPCVLPMVPILSAIIVGNNAPPRQPQGELGDDATRARRHIPGGLLAIAYVLGTSVTYAAAGAVAGASGEQLQAYFQHPAFIIAAALLLATMALAMFGLFQLQTPAFLQSRLHRWSMRVARHGNGDIDGHAMAASGKLSMASKMAAIFALGMVSALLIGACVSPLLFSVLGAVLVSASPWLGALTMFSMALGMGVVLVATGFGLGALLPHTGAWLNTVQHALAVLLLMVAIYLLGALPQVPVQILWGLLMLMMAMALLHRPWRVHVGGIALDTAAAVPSAIDASKTRGLSGAVVVRGLGAFLLIWGGIAVVGGFAGNRNLLIPLAIFFDAPHTSQVAPGITDGITGRGQYRVIKVGTVEALEKMIAMAKADGRAVVVNYYADWCLDCVRFHDTTLRDGRVRNFLAQHFVFAEVDVSDALDPHARALRRRFSIFGPPATVLLNNDGALVQRFYGYRNAEQFLASLRASLSPI